VALPELHVVIRSGSEGLGAWHAERRSLHDDALHWLGAHPGDVMRLWLIAASAFKRRRGRFEVADIRLRGGGAEHAAL
jgi:hypothetical protein